MTCERIVIINNGKLAGEGTPESLTAQLREADSLLAEIGGPRAAVRAVLEQVGGVLQVTSDGDGDGDDAGPGTYTITTRPGTDVREAVARAVVEHGFALRQLRPLDMSLEDIYLRLTTEEASVRDA